MDGGGSIAAADDGADGDDGDIDQEVSAITRVAGVIERVKVGGDGADIDELGHWERPLDRSMSASTRRTVACAQLIIATESKISGRSPSRQTTQAAQLCALAVPLEVRPHSPAGEATPRTRPNLVFLPQRPSLPGSTAGMRH